MQKHSSEIQEGNRPARARARSHQVLSPKAPDLDLLSHQAHRILEEIEDAFYSLDHEW
jgi:hypothetical protein